jgi:hypothetical protein
MSKGFRINWHNCLEAAIYSGSGPAYVKLEGRIKHDEVDVGAYVNANKRKPSVRATLEAKRIGTLSA